MKVTQVKVTVEGVKLTADAILEIIAQADPEVAGEALLAKGITDLLAALAGKALAAYAEAADQPITLETLEALRIDVRQLTPPQLAGQ